MTPQDLDLATRTVLAEAGSQGLPGMLGVANVLRNRLASGKWGDSLTSVTTAKSQFEPMAHWGTGRDNDPARFSPYSPQYQQAQRIVQGALTGELPDITKGATHFYAPAAQTALGRDAPAWASGNPTAKIGGHVFFNLDGTPQNPPQPMAMPSSPADDPTKAITAAGPASLAPPPAAPNAVPGSGMSVPAHPSTSSPAVAFGQGLFGNMFKQPGAGGAAPGAGQPAAPQQPGFLGRMLFGDGGLHGALGGIGTPNGGQGLFGGLFPHNPPLPSNPGPISMGAPGAQPQPPISMGQGGGAPPISMGAPPTPPVAPPAPALGAGGGGNPFSALMSLFGGGGG